MSARAAEPVSCPWCGYDVSWLAKGMVCPECGGLRICCAGRARSVAKDVVADRDGSGVRVVGRFADRAAVESASGVDRGDAAGVMAGRGLGSNLRTVGAFAGCGSLRASAPAVALCTGGGRSADCGLWSDVDVVVHDGDRGSAQNDPHQYDAGCDDRAGRFVRDGDGVVVGLAADARAQTLNRCMGRPGSLTELDRFLSSRTIPNRIGSGLLVNGRSFHGGSSERFVRCVYPRAFSVAFTRPSGA